MKSRRLFWHIVEKIELSIDSGTYPPGSRLPAERVLAETFEVSRPTIREAIIALEVRGRVEVKTSSGVYVLEHKNSNDDLSNISAFELTQARALIEGEAAALAASAITTEELSALDDTLIAMENGINADEADKTFHIIIAQATRNKAVQAAIHRLWELRQTDSGIKEAYQGVCCQSDSDRCKEHRDIYNALKNRDSVAARGAMHYHFNRLINALFDASEAKALEEIKRKTSETRDLYSLNHIVKSAH
ncbi:FadR/GntR family transcriptional regulator [Thalassotalea agariperforans]